LGVKREREREKECGDGKERKEDKAASQACQYPNARVRR
jgi:hypothetical protein